jgi:hypothetical protein
MNVTPIDNVDFLIKQAQSIKDIETRILQHDINLHNIHEKERVTKERLEKNRELMMLDKQYYEKAYDKSKMVKGTNVDLYI